MTQASTNSTFHRQTNQTELGRPVDANSVEFIPTVLPPDLTTNARRIWVDMAEEIAYFTVDGVDIQTLASNASFNNFTGYVNVKLPPYNAKGNGTDDFLALQAAFASGDHLLFPPGVYATSSQIVWDGKSQVVGFGHPVIKALAAMESVVICDKDNNNLIVNGVYRTGIWSNVSIDGNFLATNGYYIKRGKGLDIGHFSVLNAVNALVMLGDTTPASPLRAFECHIHDLYLPGGNGVTRALYCLFVTQAFVDSSIQNIVLNNAQTNHINNSGTNNRWLNIHPYSSPLDQQIDIMWEARGQGNHHSQLYLDSPGRVGVRVTGSVNSFANVFLLCPDFIDAVTTKPLIHIDKTTGTQISQVQTNINIALDPAKRALIRTVTIDNSTNLVFDATIEGMSHVGSVPNEDVLIIGNAPNRFSHTLYMSSATNPYYIGQEYFNTAVSTGNLTVNISFKYQVTSAAYQVSTELFWSSTVFITNKTLTGFTINFGTAVPSNGFVVTKVFLRG